MNGWIILDKPLGLGSTQAVSAVKRNLREAGYGKVKVGHGGTLDPLATGVLPIALGEATKLCGRMLDASKKYEFTVQFGRETDTLDLEGKVTATSDWQPGFGAVEKIMMNFNGEIDQIPPAYSALKVGGKRAYDLARQGHTPELATRRVTIYDWEYIQEGFVGEWDASEQYATLAVTVSKGTYIRSLARDIAYALGTVGHVTMLRRTKAGPFSLPQAISLDKLNEIGKGAALEDVILPMEAGLDDIPALTLSPEQARAIREGRVLTGIAEDDGHYWARDAEMRAVALLELIDGTTKIVRGFNL
jgi:tRNA pseudouridine55 synthase